MADRGDRVHEQWGTYLTSFCQMSKNQTPRLWRRFTKKINWHNEVHTYWRQFWCHIWWSLKSLKMSIEIIFGQFVDLHIWHQNWCQYLWTSLCQFIFFVNLLHSLHVSLFDIWHLFDILTHQLNHLSPHRAIFQGCHGTGKTGRTSHFDVHLSRQGKHREFAQNIKNMILHIESTLTQEKLWSFKN